MAFKNTDRTVTLRGKPICWSRFLPVHAEDLLISLLWGLSATEAELHHQPRPPCTQSSPCWAIAATARCTHVGNCWGFFSQHNCRITSPARRLLHRAQGPKWQLCSFQRWNSHSGRAGLPPVLQSGCVGEARLWGLSQFPADVSGGGRGGCRLFISCSSCSFRVDTCSGRWNPRNELCPAALRSVASPRTLTCSSRPLTRCR